MTTKFAIKHLFWLGVMVAVVLAYLAAVLMCGGAR